MYPNSPRSFSETMECIRSSFSACPFSCGNPRRNILESGSILCHWFHCHLTPWVCFSWGTFHCHQAEQEDVNPLASKYLSLNNFKSTKSKGTMKGPLKQGEMFYKPSIPHPLHLLWRVPIESQHGQFHSNKAAVFLKKIKRSRFSLFCYQVRALKTTEYKNQLAGTVSRRRLWCWERDVIWGSHWNAFVGLYSLRVFWFVWLLAHLLFRDSVSWHQPFALFSG